MFEYMYDMMPKMDAYAERNTQPDDDNVRKHIELYFNHELALKSHRKLWMFTRQQAVLFEHWFYHLAYVTMLD